MKTFVLEDEYTEESKPETLKEKIEEAKRALKLSAEMSKTYYNEPLIITYSGGKDSDVMLHLAETTLRPDEFEVMNSHTREFSDYPKYKDAYIKAFDRMLKVRKKRGLDFKFETAQEVFDWWIEEYKYNVKGQITIDEWLGKDNK